MKKISIIWFVLRKTEKKKKEKKKEREQIMHMTSSYRVFFIFFPSFLFHNFLLSFYPSLLLRIRVILQYSSFFLDRQPAILSYQNITFDGTILTLCSTDITCDCTFFTFGGSFIFSHIWWYHSHIMQYQHHMWLYFCYIRWFYFFFLTFDGTILTLCSINITCDCTFVTFGGFIIFFSHIW